MWLRSQHLIVGVSACGLATTKVARMRLNSTLISYLLSTMSHSFLFEGIRTLTVRGKWLVESELLGTFAWARKVRMYPRLRS